MRRGLLWLSLVDLRQAWLRPSLAGVAIALAILAVVFFSRQIGLRQAEVLAGYEEAGAATFVAEFSGVADNEIGALAGAIQGVQNVRSAEAPYSGISLGAGADTSFQVFQNAQQTEYLGARTNVLGVDQAFNPALDYYIDFHETAASAPRAVLGVPLLRAEGELRPPAANELLVASDVANYVGVRPGAEAVVDLVYTGVEPPVVQRLEGLRLVGTFDALGPDQGRFDPFWQFTGQGGEVLTVRRPDAGRGGVTTLPVVLNAEVMRSFLTTVRREIDARGLASAKPPARSQIVVRAGAVGDVPAAEAAVGTLLRQRGLEQACDAPRARSFCLHLPDRNNFQTALQEQAKVATGGAFFIVLLFVLLTAGTAGLQVQAVIARWRDYGLLQALGFRPGQILRYYGLQLIFILGGGVGLAAIAAITLPMLAGSLAELGWAAGLSVIAAGLGALPAMMWPLWRLPAELLRESQ